MRPNNASFKKKIYKAWRQLIIDMFVHETRHYKCHFYINKNKFFDLNCFGFNKIQILFKKNILYFAIYLSLKKVTFFAFHYLDKTLNQSVL